MLPIVSWYWRLSAYKSDAKEQHSPLFMGLDIVSSWTVSVIHLEVLKLSILSAKHLRAKCHGPQLWVFSKNSGLRICLRWSLGTSIQKLHYAINGTNRSCRVVL